MKKLTLLFLLLFVSTIALLAQKQFTGEIRFQTKIVGTDDPNLISSNEEQTIDIAILGNKSKTVFTVNEMMSITNVWDGDKETSFVVIEITGFGKFYNKWNAEQWKDKMKFKKYSFKYENDYKTICDYKCQKVVVTTTNLEDDSTTESILYVTKEIGSSKINGDTPGLEGFPLMQMEPLEQYCEDCYAVVEAVKITPKKIKDVDFLLSNDAKSFDDIPIPELKEKLKERFGE